MGFAIFLLEALYAVACVVASEVWAVFVERVALEARERTVLAAVWWWWWLYVGVCGGWGRSGVGV